MPELIIYREVPTSIEAGEILETHFDIILAYRNLFIQNNIVLSDLVLEETVSKINAANNTWGELSSIITADNRQVWQHNFDKRISHKATNFRIQDNDLLCDIHILKTPYGAILSDAIKSRVAYRFAIKSNIKYVGMEKWDDPPSNIVEKCDIVSIDCIIKLTGENEFIFSSTYNDLQLE